MTIYRKMNSLLDAPEIRQQAFSVSVELYHKLTEGQPTELLRGTIINKTSKSPFHQFYSDRLRRILFAQISSNWIVRQEGPLTFTDSEPEPDVSVVRGPEELYLRAHPTTADLVVEVAVSSLEIDRLKAAIYAEAGVLEYWIVCVEKREVQVYRQPQPTGYADRSVVAVPAVLESSALPGVRVDLGGLFA